MSTFILYKPACEHGVSPAGSAGVSPAPESRRGACAPSLLPALVLLVLLTAGCQGRGSTTATAEPLPTTPTSPAPTETGLPEEVREIAAATRVEPDAPPAGEKAGVVTATGELVALVESELVARQPGRIGRILVDEGSSVAAGQPLLELETEYFELEARAAAAEEARAAAAFREAERELEREKTLLETKSVSPADYDRTLATYEKARAARELAAARLELARKHLDDAVLRSPIHGVVAERRVDVGERLQATTVAFVLVRTRPLKLRFQLPERYLPAVHRGCPVRAFFDPYPGEVFQGEVSMVGQVIDPASRSLDVEALLANRDGRLRPGLFARVEMELQRPPGGIEGGELQSAEDGDAQIR